MSMTADDARVEVLHRNQRLDEQPVDGVVGIALEVERRQVDLRVPGSEQPEVRLELLEQLVPDTWTPALPAPASRPDRRTPGSSWNRYRRSAHRTLSDQSPGRARYHRFGAPALCSPGAACSTWKPSTATAAGVTPGNPASLAQASPGGPPTAARSPRASVRAAPS